jgi:hypothetical protein
MPRSANPAISLLVTVLLLGLLGAGVSGRAHQPSTKPEASKADKKSDHKQDK